MPKLNGKMKKLARILNQQMPTSHVAEYLSDDFGLNYTEVIEYLNSL